MEQINLLPITQPIFQEERLIKQASIKSYISPQQNLENVFSSVIPDSKEENKLQKARRILGNVAKEQSDQELQTFITEMQYLIDSWLDSFEKHIFEGMTLKRLLREG